MEYLYDYAAFAARLVTIVAVIATPVLIAMASAHRRRDDAGAPEIEVRKLNDRLRATRLALESVVLPPRVFRQHLKAARKADRAARRATEETAARRVYVCAFSGDLRARAVASLREEITAILAVARERDEVVVLLESAGGTIHGYGLAASQLRRVRERGIRLVTVVDKIAASGGYMMACVADEIIAAPFAIIGSIGVIAQLPNFNRLLKRHDIDFEQVTAGKYKRTLSLFGENTDEDRAKLREEIEDAHALFKAFVAEHRPALDLERVATGEHWFATRALELGLVDRIATSDQYLAEQAETQEVFQVRARRRKSLLERLLAPGRR